MGDCRLDEAAAARLRLVDHYREAYATKRTLQGVRPLRHDDGMVTVDEVRALALTLPRTTEHLVRDRVKFRVGRLVYLAFSRDETLMGFAFPKEERDALVAAEPEKFLLPRQGDLRYHWVVARLATLDAPEMAQRVTEAWTMVVPKFLVREHLGSGQP